MTFFVSCFQSSTCFFDPVFLIDCLFGDFTFLYGNSILSSFEKDLGPNMLVFFILWPISASYSRIFFHILKTEFLNSNSDVPIIIIIIIISSPFL